MPDQKVSIVGAGLAGSLLAIYLARRGFAGSRGRGTRRYAA